VTNHRATPEQWEIQEKWAPESEDAACLLELRARVEALEAELEDEVDCNNICTLNIAERLRKLEANSRPTPNPGQIRSSLVERVADAIAKADDDGLTNMTWSYHAHAAIREVAAWMKEQGGYPASRMAESLNLETAQ
jgi:hypothetical protein